jgi:type VI protein secretion system component Hcp
MMTKTNMIRTSLFALAILLLTTTALAQDSPVLDATIRPRVTITVTADGLSCTTSAGAGAFSALTWKLGVTQTTTDTGMAAGKPSFGNFNITKHVDGCSDALFASLLSGKALKLVTIVQQDRNNDDVFTVMLSDVFLSGYQLEGELSREVPTEQISFAYSKLTVSNPFGVVQSREKTPH